MKKLINCLLLLALLGTMLMPVNVSAAKEFDVDGVTKSIENDPGFVNDTDPRIVWNGPWSKNTFTPAGGVASNGGRDWTSAYAGGGRAYLGEIEGASAEFTFVGSSIMVLMTRFPDLGKVKFTLDGAAAGEIDLGNCEMSGQDDNYAAFKKTGLSGGVHTIKLENVNRPGKNGKPPAPGWIHLVGFVTDNGIINSSHSEYVKSSGFSLRTDADANQTATCCVGDDLHTTAAKNSTMTFTFKGSYVAVLSKVAAGYGRAEVEIDGVKAGTINEDESKTAIHRMVFSKGGLSSGKHTLKITTLDAKTFTVDAFIVSKSSIAATPTTAPPVATMVTSATTAGTTKSTRSGNGTTTRAGSEQTEPTAEITGGTNIGETTEAGDETTEAGGETTPDASESTNTEETGGKKTGNNTAIIAIIIVMIVLLLGVAAAAVYLLYLKPKNDIE